MLQGLDQSGVFSAANPNPKVPVVLHPNRDFSEGSLRRKQEFLKMFLVPEKSSCDLLRINSNAEYE